MKGLDLSEKYFRAYGLPLIQDKFSPFAGRISAGLAGDGSECFGFDDKISRDHDWGPGFCIWLMREDFEKISSELQEEITRLPQTFRGHGPRQVSAWGQGRTGVFEISQFYLNFTGIDHIPQTLEEWLFIPESSLATATNGKVFYDPSGEFSRWRERLLEFYPEDVRLKKIASRCMTIAQSGQYNFGRSFKRREFLAAQYSETKFCADVISLIFLLNKRYTPYYKWMHRALKGLPILGETCYTVINDFVTSHDYEKKSQLIEEICALLIQEFKNQNLSDGASGFLLDHGPLIQAKIEDKSLRERNVWVG